MLAENAGSNVRVPPQNRVKEKTRQRLRRQAAALKKNNINGDPYKQNSIAEGLGKKERDGGTGEE